jgi:AraC family transcriptional regulator, arabinose operon regulatory protein
MTELHVDTRPLRGMPVITGTDTMFPGYAYRRPQGLEDHLLVYTAHGEGYIGPAGGQFMQRPGMVLVVDPNCGVDQDVFLPEGWGRMWVIFQPRQHWYGWMDWPRAGEFSTSEGEGVGRRGYRGLDLRGSVLDGQVREQMVRMHQHARSGVRAGHALAMNALEAVLILANEGNPGPSGMRLDARLEGALSFIGAHLGGRLTLEGIAQAAHVSAPHLSRIFRGRMGRSVMSYVEQQRMTRACQLLEMTSQPIAGIARDVGFEDPFYFSTRFRRMFKVSPGAYRAVRAGGGDKRE